jgi:mycothiol synthase
MSPTCARSYSHPDDLPAVIDFLKSTRPAEWMHEYPTIVDLHEALARPSVREKTQLWFDDRGQLVAFASVLEPYNNLIFEIKQDAKADIEDELVAWGIKSADGLLGTLDISCREDDLRRIALLERHKFMRLEINTLRLARRLDGPIPIPHVPEGFSIRPIAGEQEANDLVALHRAAFGTSNMTREDRLAIMRAPEYDPALDLIVVAPGGRFGAYCTCSISTVENKLSGFPIGHTDPVAVHPDFQGRGLARALLLTGAQLLRERGVTLVMLGTSSDNLAMQAAARSAGFEVYSKRIWFSKSIPDA